MTDDETTHDGSMRRWVSDVLRPAGIGAGMTVLASLVFVGVLASAIGGGVAGRTGASGDTNGPRVGLVAGAIVVLLSLPVTVLAVVVAAIVFPAATVGVLGATLVGAAYVVGSSALGGCLADEFGSERTGRGNAATDATAAAKSPIERLKRRYVDASILVLPSAFGSQPWLVAIRPRSDQRQFEPPNA